MALVEVRPPLTMTVYLLFRAIPQIKTPPAASNLRRGGTRGVTIKKRNLISPVPLPFLKASQPQLTAHPPCLVNRKSPPKHLSASPVVHLCFQLSFFYYNTLSCFTPNSSPAYRMLTPVTGERSPRHSPGTWGKNQLVGGTSHAVFDQTHISLLNIWIPVSLPTSPTSSRIFLSLLHLSFKTRTP